MPPRHRPSLPIRLLRFFFRPGNRVYGRVPVRFVYFGLRVRFLALYTLVSACVITALALVVWFDQRGAYRAEKDSQARTLTRVLAAPAGIALDRTGRTSAAERNERLAVLIREAANFRSYSPDIVLIALGDGSGRIVVADPPEAARRKDLAGFLKKALELPEDGLAAEDFREPVPAPVDAPGAGAGERSMRAITIPVFLHGGETVAILADFREKHAAWHAAAPAARSRISRELRTKYRTLLGEADEGPPARPAAADKAAAARAAEIAARADDIDFLFLRLFAASTSARGRAIPQAERALWSEAWLGEQKRQKLAAYETDRAALAKEIQDRITARLAALAGKVESLRRLGALTVVFDVDRVNRAIEANLRNVMRVALVALAVGIIAFLFALRYLVGNLKRLERWALSIGDGNLNSRIAIASRDEVGRLGDVFNHMIGEMNEKYHLEKFVSRSTKSLVKSRRHAGSDLALGETHREELAFLFSDVRGFTAFSEQNDPATVISVLNFYLELQSAIVRAEKGDIADYVGDQIMAKFAGETRVDRALSTARRIQREVAAANATRQAEGLPVFEVGIGVHAGEVVVGNIGSGFRMDNACVGDAVNLTSRLCGAAAPGEILVSQEAFLLAKREVPTRKAAPISVKGKVAKIRILRVLSQ